MTDKDRQSLLEEIAKFVEAELNNCSSCRKNGNDFELAEKIRNYVAKSK